MGKNIGKNIGKSLSSKYRKKLLNHDKKSATDPFKTASKIAISKRSPQNSPETVTNEEENIGIDRDISRERYISP